MNTPTNGLGSLYLAGGGRRSHRIARKALKNLSEEDIKIKFIHLQGDHQFQDRTIQALRLQIEQLYATFSTAPTVPNGEMWTLVGDTIVQHTHTTVAILENFKAQVPHVLPMVGHALAKTIVNKVVAWVSVVSCNGTVLQCDARLTCMQTVWEQCIGGATSVSAV